MAQFDAWKKEAMKKMQEADKSKKGSVDEDIKELIGLINKKDNYFTTSSCSGRIIVLTEHPPHKKYKCRWIFVSHTPCSFDNLEKALQKIPDEEVWLKMESPIFHICCRTRDDANKILNKARSVGFKHSGIIAEKHRVIAEIIGTERVDAPIASEGRLLADKNYLTHLLGKANEKLRISKERLRKFQEIIS